MNTNSIRSLLQRELARRVRKNPGYSLRAFARHLDMSSGALSQIINGKRTITQKTALRLAKRLDVPQQVLRKMALEKISSEYLDLKRDQMDLLGDWAHFALIELTYVDDFKPSTSWMAKRLGLPRARIEDCLGRLLRLGILSKDSQGNIIDVTGGHNCYGDDNATAIARRLLQKRWFEKAVAAINDYDIHERSHSGITMSVDKNLLPEAIERIHRFRRELREFLGQGDKRNAVYHLCVGLFPLTNILKMKNLNQEE